MFDTFISYRRQDSRAAAGRLYDRLSAHFGDEHLFMNIDDMEPGQDFVQVLETPSTPAALRPRSTSKRLRQ